MQEQITEGEDLEAVFPEQAIVPEKVFDLTKIQSDYKSMQQEDPTKMTRMRYEKYLWLESKLVDAGILGVSAWEAQYEV